MDDKTVKYPKIDWEATDSPAAFQAFKGHCEFMFGGPLKGKSEEEKCNNLMIWSGKNDVTSILHGI